MTALPDKGFSRVVKIAEISRSPKNDDAMTLATPFDDDSDAKSYKWSEIRDALELGSNVANARWMPEKIMPLFAELDAPKLLTEQGRPTKFCAQMIARYKRFVIDDGNDYGVFSEQVRSRFVDDEPKPVTPEVLGNGDGDDEPSSLAVMETRIAEQEESLEEMIMLALIAKQDADEAERKYSQLTDKDWEQSVVKDEVKRITEEENRRRKELELRTRVRQMMGKPADQTPQP